MEQTAVKIYDLKKRTYAYALDVIKFLEELPKDYIAQVVGKQLLRSATSIGANVVEAQASPSKKDFANFYNHALKSSNESKFWLGLLGDSGKASSHKVVPIANETEELSKILAERLLTMRGRRKL